MSPLTLRRYRAERLLRHEFAAMQGRVLASVMGRLRGCGVSLDDSELEACYAVAWQGLYMAMLEGQEIANPLGWLVLVTFRRAIEEQRRHARAQRVAAQHALAGGGGARGAGPEASSERDLAAELDDRARLRHLFEGLRAHLSEREREAAVLCYLHGLPRAEAAARMGVSEARMRKLMDGNGAGTQGVAGKVGALVQSIRQGEWCEEQGSLMRGLAFGILDPAGERYRLALAHRGDCAACRAYVVSLRGLAAALPPTLLPWGLGGGLLARLGEGAHAGAVGSGSTAGATAGSGAQLGGTLGGTATATGAVGAGGAAGGGWLLAGPIGAKLAVGCLLAVGVGCAALEGSPSSARAPARHHRRLARAAAVSARAPSFAAAGAGMPSGASGAAVSAAGTLPTGSPSLAAAARASREFGPEQGAASTVTQPTASVPAHPAALARAASSGSGARAARLEASAASSSTQFGAGAQPASTAAATQAAREFSPG
jgi:DNA-directed RNA polymerase specialized sigma24 family protein